MNKVFLTGRLGKDPKVLTFQNGDRVAHFSLATSRRKKDAATGEYVDAADWHNIRVYAPPRGGAMGLVESRLRKGSAISLAGELTYSDVPATDGSDRKTRVTFVVVRRAEDIEFISNPAGTATQDTPRPAAPKPAEAEPVAEPAQGFSGGIVGDDLLGLGPDDDI